jgi:hypothetical protein
VSITRDLITPPRHEVALVGDHVVDHGRPQGLVADQLFRSIPGEIGKYYTVYNPVSLS